MRKLLKLSLWLKQEQISANGLKKNPNSKGKQVYSYLLQMFVIVLTIN